MDSTHKIKLAVFCSGAGTNAQVLMERFQKHPQIEVVLMVCNKRNIAAPNKAEKYSVPVTYINKTTFYDSEEILDHLKEYQVDVIILAGFLWLIPKYLVKSYPNTIINLHPSLLPKYGGKGMYGANVHRAVLEAKEPESGITIHIVNEQYDDGQILKQVSVPIHYPINPEELAGQIHQLEYQYFGEIIEQYVLSLLSE